MKTQTVQEIRQVLSDKITDGLVVAEHTDTAHFYRHTGEGGGLYASVTTKTSAMESGNYLKMWAANMAVEYLANAVTENMSLICDEQNFALAKRAAVMAHQNYFEDAGTTGTAGHAVVEDYLNEWIRTGQRPENILSFIDKNEPDSRVFATARSAELFCREWYVQPIASELLVASKKYKYAGTLDSLMMVAVQTKKGSGGCKAHDHMDTKSGGLICATCGAQFKYEFAIVDWKTSNSIDKESYAMQVCAYWQALYEMTGLRPKNMYIVRIDKTKAFYEVRKVVDRVAAFKAFTHICHVYDWKNSSGKKLLPINIRERVSLDSL